MATKYAEQYPSGSWSAPFTPTVLKAELVAFDARGMFVLSENQYKYFEECMTNPSKPTVMMQEAYKTILEINKSRR